MHIRTRKLIGTVALLVLVVVWALLAMGFAQMIGVSHNRLLEIADELGFKAALTSRPGAVLTWHASRLMALPRLSLVGRSQRLRYVPLLMSGMSVSR